MLKITISNETAEKLAKMAADASKAGKSKEEIEKMIREAIKIQKSTQTPTRKTDLIIDDDTIIEQYPTGRIENLMKWSRYDPEGAPAEVIRKAQKHFDNVLFMNTLLGFEYAKKGMKYDITKSDYFNRVMKGEATELKKALDTATAGEGLEWVPTGLSAQVLDMVRLTLKVGANLQHIRIPKKTGSWELPVVGGDATAYLAPQSKLDESAKFRASQYTTKKVTFDPIKLAVRVIFSEELDEDSVAAVLDLTRQNIIQALGNGLEDALLNGDTAATHEDSDVTDPLDARKAFIGLRAHANNQSYSTDISTFNTTNLRTMRKNMGKYGVDQNQLIWITGISGYISFLGLSEVITVDKYGPQATVLTGELAKFDGIPIIVSEKFRQNLNASGVYDGITTTKTGLYLARKDRWIIGDKREIRLKVKEDDETDQRILTATQRLDFDSLDDITTERIVEFGYNLTT